MLRFRRMRSRQRFASVHAYVTNHFNQERSLSSRPRSNRGLSQNVVTGRCRLIELGYRQGGLPGFGLRRMLIDERGAEKGTLQRGGHKSIQTDRVTLVPGPREEIAIVQEIFRSFVEDWKSESEIAEALYGRGTVTDLGRAWTRGTFHQILINEKYRGNNVWNRSAFKLKKRRVRNDPEIWVRAEGAFKGIVDLDLFAASNAIIGARSSKLTDDEMLKGLKEGFEAQGIGVCTYEEWIATSDFPP